MAAVVIAIVMNVSAAAITCSHQSTSMNVGEQVPVEGTCTLPSGGCSTLTMGGFELYSWAPTPIVGTQASVMGPTTVKLAATFRGFDNMIGDQGAVTETFTHRISCTQGNDTETELLNITVRMAKSGTDAKALEAPVSIPVGCLVEDVETRVLVNFGASNSSATYQSLMTGWKKSDKSAWVTSRPLSATSESQGSTNTYDAGSQPILQSIEAGPDTKSLYLVLKPSSSQAALRGSDSVSSKTWKLCMIPGDGFNYYKQLCTETFPVMRSQALCDSTGTSGAAPLRASLVLVFAMITSVIVLAATP